MKIQSVVLDENEDDHLIFTPGNFQVKEYLNQILAVRLHVQWSDTIWNSYTSQRVNALMWRLFRNALPIDDAIKKKGITLASRCCCCVQPTSEIIHHLFITSDMAR